MKCFELNEYSPGEYCKDIQCQHYHGGDFDAYCNSCSAYLYYLWLQEHGYSLLKIDQVTNLSKNIQLREG